MSTVPQQTPMPNWIRAGILAGALIVSSGALCGSVASPSPAASWGNLCDKALPDDIQHVLAAKFMGWTLQSSANLSNPAKERWKSEKPRVCPGVAKGRFESGDKSSSAVLIVRAGSSNSPAKLLLFEGTEGKSSGDFKVLQEMENGASNLFIHSVPVHQFFDKKSADRFQARTPDAIVLFDAGKDEYETDIYFWTGSEYRHEPVDY
jgi:hypothetical protein